MNADVQILKLGTCSVIGLAAVMSATFAPAQTYSEAPSLAALVAAGDLPPVAERLPVNPKVVEAAEIGSYGGILRTTDLANRHRNTLVYVGGAEMFFRFDNDQVSQPQLIERWEANDDATQYTLHLREGVKWSDGHPFTVDDVLFWFEDLATNEEFNPGFGLGGWVGGLPNVFRSNVDGATVPPVMEKVDDHTFTVNYPISNGTLPIGAASWHGNMPTRIPKHYLEQFHPRYNPDVQALAEAEGFPNWVALMRAKMDFWSNADMPVVNPWKLTTGIGDSSVVEAERNPYYWKVDAEGNQLPYIDTLRWTIVEDNEVALLRTLAGDVDAMISSPILSPENQALFFDNADRGNYRLHTVSAAPVVSSFDLNLTVADPIKRAVFRDKNFRIGLSHALNRQEMSDLVYLGVKEPQQFAPTPGSVVYDEEFATQFLEYDVDLANQYLDLVLPEKDSEGFRLGPDGERFSFVLELEAGNANRVAEVELMQLYFAAVGVDTDISALDRELVRQKRNNNDFDSHYGITTTGNFASLMNFNPFPIYQWPNNLEYNGTLWTNWHLGLTPAEEPPAGVVRGLEAVARMQATPVEAEQIAAGLEIMAESRELFITMGTLREGPGYAILNNRLANVIEPIFSQPYWPGTADPEIWFFKE